jgi:transcriptional regulator with XRE-family HTH domain
MAQEGTDVMANDRDSRSDLAVWLGEELRRARLAAGYTSQEQFARELGFDRTVIVKAETGARPPSDDMAARIAEMFPDLCNGLYVRLAEIARKSNGPIPGWFADWVEIEARAAILRWWEPLLIPGLLQTEDYARAVLSTWRRDTADEVEAKVAIRLARQSVLASADFRVLLDESVLHRRIGAPEVMAMQLEYLLAIGTRPNITIQVIPDAAGAYLGLSGAFAIAEVPGESATAYLETGVQGITVRDPTLVSSTARLFDDLRDEALSRSRSLELIAEVEKS